MVRPFEPGDISKISNGSYFVITADGGIGWRWLDSRVPPYSDRVIDPVLYPLIGRLPPDQLDATEWKAGYHLPQPYRDDPEKNGVRWCDKNQCWGWYEKKGDLPDCEQPFTWRGWKIQKPADIWLATKEGQQGVKALQVREGLPEVLDRIAEAEGLRSWTDQSHKLDDQGALKQELATERAAREKAEQHRKSAFDLKNQYFQAKMVVEQAFRAATGQEYEEGKDYSKKELPVLKEGDRFKFLTFPDNYGYRPAMLKSTFVMGPDGKASYDRIREGPLYMWKVEGTTYELIEPSVSEGIEPGVWRRHPIEEKKGSRMLKFLKFSPKFGAFVVAAWLCGNTTTVKDFVVEWWNAPTALELGDWVKVYSCDSCARVHLLSDHGKLEISEDTTSAEGMCPSCGGETFSLKKAQHLLSDTWYNAPTRRGYAFKDGSVSLEPGEWKVPERTIKL